MRVRSLLPVAALAAAGLMPNAATAEEGCVGVPSVPATYFCVGVYPENAVPALNPSGDTRNVTVPEVCYFAGCTAPVTTEVPVPTVSPSGPSGQVVTITWGGGQDLGEVLERALCRTDLC